MSHKLSLVKILESNISCVNALSFSPCGQFIAAARQQSVVEIYEVETRVHLASLRELDENASVRTIVWIPKSSFLTSWKLCNYRLITAGLHGIMVDWDMETLQQSRSCSSYGGAIFSAAISCCGIRLLVACDDGCVRSFLLWNVFDCSSREPDLNFEGVHTHHIRSILSICTLPDGSYFCGTADSLIFMCNTLSNEPSCKMKIPSARTNMVSEPRRKYRHKEKYIDDQDDSGKELAKESDTNIDAQIWSLIYIQKHNLLASGDSLGNVILWNVDNCTMSKIFTQHTADVLALAVGNDGDTFFSAGVDTKIAVYAYGRDSFDGESGLADWNVSGVKYHHKGDVRCLATHPKDDRIGSTGSDGVILISNGLKHVDDRRFKGKLISLNAPSWIASPVVMNSEKTLSLCKYRYHCDLWYMPRGFNRRNKDAVNDDLNDHPPLLYPECGESEDKDTCTDVNDEKPVNPLPYKIATIRLNYDEGHIVAVSISPDGGRIAVANQKKVHLLKFDALELGIRKEKMEYGNFIAQSLQFVSGHEIIIAHFVKDVQKFKISLFDLNTKKISLLQKATETINHPIIKFSVPSASVKTPSVGYVFAFSLVGQVYLLDLKDRATELPNLEKCKRIVCISPSPDHKYLAIFCSGYCFYFYDIKEKRIVNYDGRTIHRIPNKVVGNDEQIYNAIWCTHASFNRMFIQTSDSIISIRLDETPFGEDASSGRADSKIKANNISSDSIRGDHSNKLKVYIGPRRFFAVPSIRSCLYQPPALFNAVLENTKMMEKPERCDVRNLKQHSVGKYSCIKKVRFFAHLEVVTTRSKGKEELELIAFHLAPNEDTVFHRKRYGT